MRPVEKGEAPRSYSKYGQAINDLEGRLDIFCSYCERKFQVGLEVEHKSPKSRDPDRELDWNNFLLSCKNCNGTKGTDPDPNELGDYLWPDQGNTILALNYGDGGLISPSEQFGEEIRSKADKLLDLVGLNRFPGHPDGKEPTDRDSRYSDREEVWSLALLEKRRLDLDDNAVDRERIVTMARGYGFFSVWMTVFKDDSDMRLRLINSLKGTSLECFDDEGNSVHRPGGQV